MEICTWDTNSIYCAFNRSCIHRSTTSTTCDSVHELKNMSGRKIEYTISTEKGLIIEKTFSKCLVTKYLNSKKNYKITKRLRNK